MSTLVLVRHGESLWNLENRFTGWKDVDLTALGIKEAEEAGMAIKSENLIFDHVYTSVLARAVRTLNILSHVADIHWSPVTRDWRLNERHYGDLTGLNKAETAAKHGEEQVKIWRRSYDVPPPSMNLENPDHPRFDIKYRDVPRELLPVGESLKDTVHRVRPTWEAQILPRLFQGQTILVVAHGNSLRAMLMTIENLTPEEVLAVNIPTGIPLLYKFDPASLRFAGKKEATVAKPAHPGSEKLKFIEKRYLGDPEKLKAAVAKVEAQGKAKPRS